MLPPRWAGPRNLPRKIVQLNFINKAIASCLQVSETTLPLPTQESRVILPGGKTFPGGALLARYHSKSEAANIRKRLQNIITDVRPYSPIMAHVECKGWPNNLTANDINNVIQKNKYKIPGLLCCHTLSSAYQGTAQFLVPSYLQNDLQFITNTFGKPISEWWWLKEIQSPTAPPVSVSAIPPMVAQMDVKNCV